MKTVFKLLRNGWLLAALIVEVLILLWHSRRNPEGSSTDGSQPWFWWIIGQSYRAEQLDRKVRCLERYSQVTEATACIWVELGDTYSYMNRWDEAAAAAERALAIDPNHWGAYDLKARALVAMGKWQEAIAPLRQALWLAWYPGDDAALHARLAAVYEVLGDLHRAGEHWRRAIAIRGCQPEAGTVGLDWEQDGE